MKNTLTNYAALSSKITNQAAIYCGTYAKYNNGSIKGAWIDLTLVSDEEEFNEICSAIHEDEEDAEFMFQDWQSIPARYISESGLDSEYFEYKDKIEGMSETMAEAYEEYINEGGYNGEEFEDMYQGQYESEEAFAEQLLDDCGTLNDIPQHLRYYFDYTAYARDLFIKDYFITSNGFVFIRH